MLYYHTTNTKVQNLSLEKRSHLPTASRGARGEPGLWSYPDSVRTHLMSLTGSGGRVEGTLGRTQEGGQEEPHDRWPHTGAHSLHAFFLLPKLLIIEAEVVNGFCFVFLFFLLKFSPPNKTICCFIQQF